MDTAQNCGVLLVDKPAGITSAKTLSQIKHSLGIQKLGHAGTLDPFATGLLVVLIGRATKLASYAESGAKTYSGSILFGVTTNSDDITGEKLSESLVDIDLKQIQEIVAAKFCGVINQIPPRVSALKVGGKRAYKLEREGVDFELQSRSVTISSFEVWAISNNEIGFRISCSKGTYIRSIARDLGTALGCGACLATLRRERSYPFDVTDAKAPDQLSLDDIVDWGALFPSIPVVDLDSDLAKRLVSGEQAALGTISKMERNAERLIYSCDGRNLGLLVRDNHLLQFGVNLV